MTRHDRYAAAKGYTLVKIQGHMEWWQTREGRPMLYNRDTRRWSEAYCTPV